jgi:hypothetical protein
VVYAGFLLAIRRPKLSISHYFTARVAAEDTGSGLFHDLPDQQRHFIELPAQGVQRRLTLKKGDSMRKISAKRSGLDAPPAL